MRDQPLVKANLILEVLCPTNGAAKGCLCNLGWTVPSCRIFLGSDEDLIGSGTRTSTVVNGIVDQPSQLRDGQKSARLPPRSLKKRYRKPHLELMHRQAHGVLYEGKASGLLPFSTAPRPASIPHNRHAIISALRVTRVRARPSCVFPQYRVRGTVTTHSGWIVPLVPVWHPPAVGGCCIPLLHLPVDSLHLLLDLR